MGGPGTIWPLFVARPPIQRTPGHREPERLDSWCALHTSCLHPANFLIHPAYFLIPLGNPTLLNLRQYFLFYARFFLSCASFVPGWVQRGRAGHNRVGFRSKPAKTLSTRARGVGAIQFLLRPGYVLGPLGNPTLEPPGGRGHKKRATKK